MRSVGRRPLVFRGRREPMSARPYLSRAGVVRTLVTWFGRVWLDGKPWSVYCGPIFLTHFEMIIALNLIRPRLRRADFPDFVYMLNPQRSESFGPPLHPSRPAEIDRHNRYRHQHPPNREPHAGHSYGPAPMASVIPVSPLTA